MITIIVATDGEDICPLFKPLISSGDVGSVTLEVKFDESWDGYSKSATFFTEDKANIYEVVLSANKCTVPSEVLSTRGFFFIGLRGVDSSGVVQTSNLLRYKVVPGAKEGTNVPTDPTSTTYQQILTAYGDTQNKVDDLTAYIEKTTPTINVSKEDGVSTLTISDINGITTSKILDGSKGDKGDTGPSPVLRMGAVFTLANNQDATADFIRNGEDYILNLSIPKGADGNSATGGTVTIVNNLVSGGTTEALSAEQGKILNTQVQDIAKGTGINDRSIKSEKTDFISGGSTTTITYTTEPDFTNLVSVSGMIDNRYYSTAGTGNPINNFNATGNTALPYISINSSISESSPIRIKGIQFYGDKARAYGADASGNQVLNSNCMLKGPTTNTTTDLVDKLSKYMAGNYDADNQLLTITKCPTEVKRLYVCGVVPDKNSVIATIGEEIKYKQVPHSTVLTSTRVLAEDIQISTDTALTDSVKPANAKAVGDRLTTVENKVKNIESDELPDYVVTNINKCISELNTVQTANTASIVFITDLHVKAFSTIDDQSYNGINRAIKSMLEIEKYKHIDFHINGGDNLLNSANSSTHAKVIEAYDKLNTMFKKLPRLFICKGNHDDNSLALTGDTLTLSDVIYDDERYRHFGKYYEDNSILQDCNYYQKSYGYYDLPSKKIRLIFLNTSDPPYIKTDDGTGLKYRGQSYATVSDSQLNFVANALKFSAPGWGVIFFSHIALTSIDSLKCSTVGTVSTCIWEIIKAYKNNSIFKKSVTSGDFIYNVNVDYRNNASNEVIACICGHNHQDKTGVAEGIRFISTGSASTSQSTTLEDDTVVSATPETSTETLYDIFTIDRQNKTIYATRYGLGNSRTFNY